MAEQREVQRVAAENARARLAAILAQGGEAVLVVDAGGQPLITSAAYTALFGEGDPRPPLRCSTTWTGNPSGGRDAPGTLAHGEPFQLGFLLPAADGLNGGLRPMASRSWTSRATDWVASSAA